MLALHCFSRKLSQNKFLIHTTFSMTYQVQSIRAFIGAQNYEESRTFYRDLGFTESVIDPKMSYFRVHERLGFYLQDYYVKDWVDNSMIFLEVDDVQICYKELEARGLHHKYSTVRLSEIKEFEHGWEVFMHDPAGVLWHFCQFKEGA